MINLHKLFTDVFDPQPGETALVLLDTPHNALADTPAWGQRRAMGQRWHAALGIVAAYSQRLSSRKADVENGVRIRRCQINIGSKASAMILPKCVSFFAICHTNRDAG